MTKSEKLMTKREKLEKISVAMGVDITPEQWTEIEKILEEEDGTNSNSKTLRIETVISNVLLNVGIPSHIKGYKFLRSAIILEMENEADSAMVIYQKVALENGTTPSRVERAIRHAVGIAWNHGDFCFQKNVFGASVVAATGKPTNVQFVKRVAEYIKQNMM